MKPLHDMVVYWGDAKKANFMATDDGEVLVLVFKTAGILGDRPWPIRTFILKDPAKSDTAHFLVSVLHPLWGR
jgi:hypothetical protein